MARRSKNKNKANVKSESTEATESKKGGQLKQLKESKVFEIEAVPGFFGIIIAPNQRHVWTNEDDIFCMQLVSAALTNTAQNGRTTLFVTVKGVKIALCTLVPDTTLQWNLSQSFTAFSGEVVLECEGSNSIHLCGFIETQDEEDDEEDDKYQMMDHAMLNDEQYDALADTESMDSTVDGEEVMIFGASTSASEEEEETEEEDNESRFEVLEERLHGVEQTKQEDNNKKESDKKKSNNPVNKDKIKNNGSEKQDIGKANGTTKSDKVVGKKRTAENSTDEPSKKQKSSKRAYKGVTIEEHTVGKGNPIKKGNKVSILYKGKLEKNGVIFDKAQNRQKPFKFRHGIGDVIKGMDFGIEGMRAGGKRTITIPSKLGYGSAGAPPSIPPNATLIFDIELL